MHSFFRKSNFLPLFVLLLVEVILFIANYKHGAYFLGWDNLAPELNLSENIKRSFFGIWQEYRGLGLLDGMSFAANLPHYLFTGLLSFVLPENLVRYTFIFFTHLLGGIGIYYLLLELLHTYSFKRIASFFGSLFYLLNIATVQMFFIPYEVFTVHYAFLPILLLFAIKYLKSGKKKHLFWFSCMTLFSIPQAHVPTLFIVYGIALFTTLLFSFLQLGKIGLKRVVSILIVTVIINSFWAFPFAYSTLENAKVIANSKINQMGTEDIFRRNQAFGDLLDVVLLRGFALDFIDIKAPGINGYMMEDWREYANSLLFAIIGIFFFTIALLGGIKSIGTKKKQFYPFILLFIFSFLMLGTTIPLLSTFSSFFYSSVPYFFQIFRFTFTKFSILYAFSFSILFAFGTVAIFQLLGKNKYIKYVLILGFFVLIAGASFPSFRGHFFYTNLKEEIPQEYFAMIDYFKGKDHNTRIALLPQPSFWGWTYNQWGYRGSGFIWFGLPQATLDGAFYPWSRQNENYYWEITYAIYSGNANLLDSVLEKYQINWLVIDHSIITPFSPKSLYVENLEKLIKTSKKISFANSFGKNNIYQVTLNNKPQSFISLTNELPRIEPTYKANNIDQAYVEFGDYSSGTKKDTAEPEIYYPFRSLFTGKSQEEHEFRLKETESAYSLEFKIPDGFTTASLLIPPIESQSAQEIDRKDLSSSIPKIPEVHVGSKSFYPNLYNDDLPSSELYLNAQVKGGETITISVPKINGYYSYNSLTANDLFSRNAYSCINKPGETGFNKIELNNKKIVQLESIDTDLCYDVYLPNLTQQLSYLISVSSRNKNGRPFIVWLENQNSRRADIESYVLPSKDFTSNYFIQPPMEYYGLGYTLHLQNRSIGREKTTNEFENIQIHPFPFTFLTDIKIASDEKFRKQEFYSNFKVNHPNPSLYSVDISSQKNVPDTLLLSQSYHDGWKAYVVEDSKSRIKNFLQLAFPFLLGQEIKSHIVINNWGNGWKLDESQLHDKNTRIVIVYLPQYLEYGGFFLLGNFLLFSLGKVVHDRRRRRKEAVSL